MTYVFGYQERLLPFVPPHLTGVDAVNWQVIHQQWWQDSFGEPYRANIHELLRTIPGKMRLLDALRGVTQQKLLQEGIPESEYTLEVARRIREQQRWL